MTNHHLQDPTDTPITEVIVRRDGAEIARHLCESEQEAADIIAHWTDVTGVECEVVDLATGRDEGAKDIDWADPVDVYPPVDPGPAG